MVSYSVFGHGNIFVKTSPAGRPIKIRELTGLDLLYISRQENQVKRFVSLT